MAERIYIDGVDVLATYGAYPLGYDSLLSWPILKPIKVVDWPDEDGVEADLTNPLLDATQCSLNIAVRNGNLEAFMEFIYSGHTHAYIFEEIGLTKTLRLVGSSDMITAKSLGFVTLLLAEDAPMQGYEYAEPSSTINLVHAKGMLAIDGRDITDYGGVVLAGAVESAIAYPFVKAPLTISATHIPGVVVDTEAEVRVDTRQVAIPILLRAINTDEFWRNYNALLWDIIRPELRILEVGDVVPLYGFYNGMSVEAFSAPRYSGDTMWMHCTIAFTIVAERAQKI